MSLETNKALVRNFVRAINARDWERLDALVAPGFVRHSYAAGGPGVRSREELKAFLCEEFEVFPDARERVEDMIAERDSVAARHLFRGTQRGPLGLYPPTQLVMVSEYLAIYRIEGGQIAEAWAEWDNLHGLRQLGHDVVAAESLRSKPNEPLNTGKTMKRYINRKENLGVQLQAAAARTQAVATAMTSDLDVLAYRPDGKRVWSAKQNPLRTRDLSAASTLLPNGIDLHYVYKCPEASIRLGTDRIREAIVLVHGYSDSWRSYEEMLELLPFEGYNVPVFALDMRGHGRSSASATGDYSQQAFADDIAAFAEALKIQKLVLVGHSMGGLIAHKFAVEYPEKVKALILIATWASMSGHPVIDELRSSVEAIADDAPAPVDYVEEFQASMFYNPAEPGVLYRYVSESLRLTGRVWKAVLEGIVKEDHRDRLSEVAAPVLILWGEQDPYTGRNEQDELIALLPHAQFLSYPHASHMLNVEQTDEVIAAIRAFLGAISPSRDSVAGE